jgi:hypothetical protein
MKRRQRLLAEKRLDSGVEIFGIVQRCGERRRFDNAAQFRIGEAELHAGFGLHERQGRIGRHCADVLWTAIAAIPLTLTFSQRGRGPRLALSLEGGGFGVVKWRHPVLGEPCHTTAAQEGMLRMLPDIFLPVPAPHAFRPGGVSNLYLQLWDHVAGHRLGWCRLG